MNNYPTAWPLYTAYTGLDHVDFERFKEWAFTYGITVTPIQFPDICVFNIYDGYSMETHQGGEHMIDTIDIIVNEVLSIIEDTLSDGLVDEVLGLLDVFNEIKIPDTKMEKTLLYEDFLAKAKESMGEISRLVAEDNHISDKCDRRIYDAILYLLAAKKSIR